jgi:hypothetical protein
MENEQKYNLILDHVRKQHDVLQKNHAMLGRQLREMRKVLEFILNSHGPEMVNYLKNFDIEGLENEHKS